MRHHDGPVRPESEVSAVCEPAQRFLDLRLGNREPGSESTGIRGAAGAAEGLLDRHTNFVHIHTEHTTGRVQPQRTRTGIRFTALGTDL